MRLFILLFCSGIFIPHLFAVKDILKEGNYSEKASFWEITRMDGKLKVVSGPLVLMLNEDNAFRLEHCSVENTGGGNLIRRISLSAGEKDGRTVYENKLGRENIIELNLSADNEKMILELTQKWPAFKAKKVIEFYRGEDFFRIAFELTFTKDASMRGIWFSVSTSPEADYMIRGNGDRFLSVKSAVSEKDKWMAFDRSAANRCFAFFYGVSDTALAVMCPDRKSWMEIAPRSFMCNRAGGGFSIDFGKFLKRDVRSGEKVCFDFFIKPFGCKVRDFERKTVDSYKYFLSGIDE